MGCFTAAEHAADFVTGVISDWFWLSCGRFLALSASLRKALTKDPNPIRSRSDAVLLPLPQFDACSVCGVVTASFLSPTTN